MLEQYDQQVQFGLSLLSYFLALPRLSEERYVLGKDSAVISPPYVQGNFSHPGRNYHRLIHLQHKLDTSLNSYHPDY